MLSKIKALSVILAVVTSGYAVAQSPAATDKPTSAISSDQTGYDQVGYAGISGDETAGKTTASGEIVNPVAVTITHASLPVPSYVEITNLDTGRTVLARVNDNANILSGQIAILSKGTARQLGVETARRVPVRVRKTNPPEFERATLRQGLPASERIETPPALLGALRKMLGALPAEATNSAAQIAPKPVLKPGRPKTKPATATGADFASAAVQPTVAAIAPGKLFIQVAAFASQANANAFAKKLAGNVVAAGAVYRVRLGPYATDGDARAALGQIRAKGYRDASIVR